METPQLTGKTAILKAVFWAFGLEQEGIFIVSYLYMPAMTQDLGFLGLIKRTTLFSRLFRQAIVSLTTYLNPDSRGGHQKKSNL